MQTARDMKWSNGGCDEPTRALKLLASYAAEDGTRRYSSAHEPAKMSESSAEAQPSQLTSTAPSLMRAGRSAVQLHWVPDQSEPTARHWTTSG